MTDTLSSLVILVPAASKAKANALAWAMGQQPQDGDSFNMPASTSGSAPATYWYLRAQASAPFLDTVTACKAGTWPDSPPAGGAWSDYGLASTDLTALSAAMIVDSISMADLEAKGWHIWDHAPSVLAANGLKAVVETSSP